MGGTHRPQPKSQLVLTEWVSPLSFFLEREVDLFARRQMHRAQRELAAA